MPTNRRQFLTRLAAVTAATSTSLRTNSAPARPADRKHSICVFTKPFNSLSYEEIAEKTAAMGYDGIEAPIRKGGHIEPAQAAEELPKLIEALAKHSLEITVMTSDINDPADPTTEKILRVAATSGIKRYRMKYVHYDAKRPIKDQLADWHDRFKDLAALNHDFGITGLYQNHAGAKYMGAAIWDLDRVLEGIPSSDIGMAYDIRHATVEGGTSWPVTFRMIREHIDTVYVKDFVWRDGKVSNVPLGEGLVDAKFFKMLADSGFTGPISLHEEYLDHRDPELVPDHVEAMSNDLAKLRNWLR